MDEIVDWASALDLSMSLPRTRSSASVSTSASTPPPPALPVIKTLEDTLRILDAHLPSTPPAFGRPMRTLFPHPPNYTPLNHGSFGSTPLAVSAVGNALRTIADAYPDHFGRTLFYTLLTATRKLFVSTATAGILPPDINWVDVVFTLNATTAVNTVLRNLDKKGGMLVGWEESYGACVFAMRFLCDLGGYSYTLVPTSAEDDGITALEELLSTHHDNVAMVLIDAVSSVPAKRTRAEHAIALCKRYNVLSVVDAAHGVGLIDLAPFIPAADVVISNLHKWLFVPRGCAMLWVNPDSKLLVRAPVSVGWGYASLSSADATVDADGDSLMGVTHSFIGTGDHSAFLCVAAALRFRAWLGGEAVIRKYVNRVAREGAEIIARILYPNGHNNDGSNSSAITMGTEEIAMYNILLPIPPTPYASQIDSAKLQAACSSLSAKMLEQTSTFIPTFFYKGHLWARISGQIYLESEDFEIGGKVLKNLVDIVNSEVLFSK
jgi:selenocysteine lyase/cysteine desulfurase